MSKVAIIAGSSGAVGTQLLHVLCASPHYTEVIQLVRKPSGFIHAKAKEYIIDFDRLEDYRDILKGDVFFSCLGSTKAKTPDKEIYFRIDHDYPLKLAQLAFENHIPQFHLVSSIGANEKSSTFYLNMKGKTERDISTIPFSGIYIYRPSFLDGYRDDVRILERISIMAFKLLKPLMQGFLKKYRSISVKDVAKAMLEQSLKEPNGIHIYESDEIQSIADGALVH